MQTRLDSYSTAPQTQTYKDFLRSQGQEDLKGLPPLPSIQPLATATPQQPQEQGQGYSMDDYNKVLEQLGQLGQGGEGQNTPQPYSQGSQYNGSAPITQAFGNRSSVEHFSGGINYGADFGVPQGTQANVPQGQWQVLQAYNKARNGYEGDGENSGYGNSVLIQNKQTGEKLRLSHLSQVNVQPGQQFSGGTVGLTGQTGNATGPHLDAEYYDPSGKIRDITQTQYANSLFGGGNHGVTNGKGGGNPLLDFGKSVLSNLDPANENTPIIGPIRKFNREHIGMQPYADPSLPWDKRALNAVTQYGNSFMMGHGAMGDVPKPNASIAGAGVKDLLRQQGQSELAQLHGGQDVNPSIHDTELYHGGRPLKTSREGVTWFSDNEDVAGSNAMEAWKWSKYKNAREEFNKQGIGHMFKDYFGESGVEKAKVSLKNPYVVDAKGAYYLEVPTPKELRGKISTKTTDTDLIADWARRNGYDGAIFKNVAEGKGAGNPTDTTYAVFKPESFNGRVSQLKKGKTQQQ